MAVLSLDLSDRTGWAVEGGEADALLELYERAVEEASRTHARAA